MRFSFFAVVAATALTAEAVKLTIDDGDKLDAETDLAQSKSKRYYLVEEADLQEMPQVEDDENDEGQVVMMQVENDEDEPEEMTQVQDDEDQQEEMMQLEGEDS